MAKLPGNMLIEFDRLGKSEAYKLLISALVPRPIAFISSQDEQGKLNLAPFSFFMGAGTDPPRSGDTAC